MAKFDFWIGLLLGTVVGRTVDLIPDRPWLYFLAFVVIFYPVIVIKDWVTDYLHRERDQAIALRAAAGKPMTGLPKLFWGPLDFYIGFLILTVAVGLLEIVNRYVIPLLAP